MKQLRRDNTGAGPRRCRSPPIVTTVVEGERRSPGSSSWRSSIRELPSLSQAGTGSRTMAPRGWRQRRKALWSGEAIVTNFEGAEKSDRLEKSSICEIVWVNESTVFGTIKKTPKKVAAAVHDEPACCRLARQPLPMDQPRLPYSQHFVAACSW